MPILNCDIGEEIMTPEEEREMLSLVSAVNIACGVHAGSVETMERLVMEAMEHGVAIGAHPSLDDRENFGRKPMPITPEDAYRLVVDQSLLLLAITLAAGGRMAHVKPHGALYTMAARDIALADAIARAVRDIDPSLVLFGLSGSESIAAGTRWGLRTANEVFPDRGYLLDGTLAPRGTPGALITDPELIARRALRMMTEGRVTTVDGIDIVIAADTICIHGDNANALAAARLLKSPR